MAKGRKETFSGEAEVVAAATAVAAGEAEVEDAADQGKSLAINSNSLHVLTKV